MKACLKHMCPPGEHMHEPEKLHGKRKHAASHAILWLSVLMADRTEDECRPGPHRRQSMGGERHVLAILIHWLALFVPLNLQLPASTVDLPADGFACNMIQPKRPTNT